MSDIFSGPPKYGDSSNTLLMKIWFWMHATAEGITGGGTGGGVQRTLTSSAVTTDGTVSAGAKSVSFVTSSDFSGTINGVAFPVSASKNVAPISPADTIAAIPYTVSAGTIYIDVLT